MAGTIALTTGMTHTNGTLSVPIAAKTKTIVQAAQGAFADTQTIATSDTAVTIGGIATLGIVWIENLDSVNFVEVGSYVAATFYPLIRILAGERYPFRAVPGTTLYAKADTAAVKIQKNIYEA